MNKKLWVLVAAICLLLPVSLSAEVLDFSIGGTAQYNYDASQSSSDDFFNAENYSFGAEARVKFLIVEASDLALVGPTSDGWQVTNLMTAGLSFDLLNLVRLGVGLGPEFEINVSDDGVVTDANGDAFEFASIFMDANCTYKANVDFLLGGITLSANYTIPSKGFNIQNIVDGNFSTEDLLPEGSEYGRVGVSVLISLI
jgi:hypothetical protein